MILLMIPAVYSKVGKAEESRKYDSEGVMDKFRKFDAPSNAKKHVNN